MKGIYLTQEGKQQIEAQIAELEYKNSIVGGITYKEVLNIYKKILSSATILPVEDSWIKIGKKHGVTSILSEYYPNGVIIQPK